MAFDNITKDPDAVKPYSVDWSDYLGADTIASSSWAVSGGVDTTLVVDSATNDTTSSTVVVSGGTDRRAYDLTNTITTAGGITDDRTIRVYCSNQ